MGETVGDGSCVADTIVVRTAESPTVRDKDSATLLGKSSSPDPTKVEVGSGGSDVGETERAPAATSVLGESRSADPAKVEVGSGGSDVGETERAPAATSVQQQERHKDILARAQPPYVPTCF